MALNQKYLSFLALSF